jgi:hypothetical protein
MTAQVRDRFLYGDGSYSLLCTTGLKFDPRSYGIVPSMASTACYRGYWCVYKVIEGKLYLDELYVHSRDGNYPKINGVDVCTKGLLKKKIDYMGCCLYKGLKLQYEFDGKILLGRDFDSSLYVHMGFHDPWKYRELTELVFKKGELIEVNDHSEIGAKLREMKLNEEMFLTLEERIERDKILKEKGLDVWWA